MGSDESECKNCRMHVMDFQWVEKEWDPTFVRWVFQTSGTSSVTELNCPYCNHTRRYLTNWMVRE